MGLAVTVATEKNSGNNRSKSPRGPSTLLVFVIMVMFLLLVVGSLVTYLVWSLWSQSQAAAEKQAAETARHAHDRLIRTDPIVGLWQSHDASFQNMAGLFDHYNLTIYNDHTYVIYDRINHTSIDGTWVKTGNYDTTDLYTVFESGKTFPATTISHGHNGGYLQYTYMYRDSPPDSILEFINYELVDYYDE